MAGGAIALLNFEEPPHLCRDLTSFFTLAPSKSFTYMEAFSSRCHICNIIERPWHLHIASLLFHTVLSIFTHISLSLTTFAWSSSYLPFSFPGVFSYQTHISPQVSLILLISIAYSMLWKLVSVRKWRFLRLRSMDDSRSWATSEKQATNSPSLCSSFWKNRIESAFS